MTRRNEEMSLGLSRRGALRAGTAAALLPLAAPLSGCGLFNNDKKPILVGHRENVLSVGAGLTVDPADTTPISLSEPVAVAQWPQPGRIPSHLSVNAIRSGMTPRWVARIGEGGVLSAQPMVAEDRVYSMDAAGVVSAFALHTGKLIWRTPTKPKKMRSSNLGGGLSVAEGVVYVVDGVAESLALDAETGEIRWRVDVGTPGRSAPTIVAGRMVFGTIDDRLIALESATGRQIWAFSATQSETIVFGQPAPAIVDDVALAGFGSGDIAAIRMQTGEAVWTDTLGAFGGRNSIMDFSSIHGLPAIADGTAYAISLGQVLTAIDMRSGRRLWERTVSGKDNLIIAGDLLFVLSVEQQLACLDKNDGHVRWVTVLPRFRRQNVQKGTIVWTGPVLADGKLICVSDYAKQAVISVDAVTGALGPVMKLKSPSRIAPIVAQGLLLVVTDDGKLTAYG